MIRPWIKVCGLTRRKDALAAVQYGARAVGFILYPGSPRYIHPEVAAEIIRSLPPRVGKVAVTVDAPPEFVMDLKLKHGFTALQAHGEESPEECARYVLPVVKAIRCTPGLEAHDIDPYREYPVLLDGYTRGHRGGTGLRADWSLGRQLKEAGFRVLLAGGLSAGNALQAIEAVAPHALDFNSQVEQEPGIKDHHKLKTLHDVLRPLEDPERESWPWQ